MNISPVRRFGIRDLVAAAGFVVLACACGSAVWAGHAPVDPQWLAVEATKTSNWEVAGYSKARLITVSENSGDGADGLRVVEIGVQIVVDDGWKTYAADPGPLGLPPRFDWSGSTNFQSFEIAWPTPHQIGTKADPVLGYGGTVILPVKITLRDAGVATGVRLALDYAVCSNICVPVHADLSLDIDRD